jgi:hypothetical protein
MDCRRVDSWLPAFLEDVLPPRRAEALERHLSACPRCRRERRALETALGALDRAGRHVPAIDLWSSFAERLAAERSMERRPSLGPWFWLWRPVAGLAALGVAAGACFLTLLLAHPTVPVLALRAATDGSRGWLTALSIREDEGPGQAPALRPLPSIASPEPRAPMPVVTESAPRPPARPQVRVEARADAVPSAVAAHSAAPDATESRSEEASALASVAVVLMDAPQDAARAEVARELIALAEEMVRASEGLETKTEDAS